MMSKYDSLGDRMKLYEDMECGRKFMPRLPVYARIDGRAFSKFTRGMSRPYDESMTAAMIETTRHLVEQTNATIGYTQSDEISLMWHENVFFDGRIQKMTSQLAAIASVYFLKEAQNHWPQKVKTKLPTFDARVFQLPSIEEAINCFVWREWDATKNSISMAAQSVYSHKELMNKNSSQKQDMLFEKGINWNDYPISFKRGTYVKRILVDKEIDDKTWAKIPEDKRPESKVVKRSIIRALCLDPITSYTMEERKHIFVG